MGVHVHWSVRGLRIYVPVRYKMTFYISSVSLIGMASLAAICIVESRSDSLSLVADRLAQFASIRASQIERDLSNQAAFLDFTMQGGLITTAIMGLYLGNITAQSWAANLRETVDELFTTTMRGYEALVIYDVSGNLVFSMANPSQSSSSIEKLIPAMPEMLPFGKALFGQNVTLPYNGSSTVSDTVESAAASAAIAAARSAATSSSSAKPNLPFAMTTDNVSAWISRPAPLVSGSGLIEGYNYALTVPVSYATIDNKTQVSQPIGYCSAILDCSHYMNYTAVDDVNDLRGIAIMKDSWVTVAGVSGNRWYFMFPTGLNATADTALHPFSESPALGEDIRLFHRFENNTRKKPGGAAMKTTTSRAKKASVGYSFVRAANVVWYLTIELPRSQAEVPIWHLTKVLCAVAVSLLVLVTGAAYLLSAMATFPLFHIYRAMELRFGENEDTDTASRHYEPNVKDLVLIAPALHESEGLRSEEPKNGRYFSARIHGAISAMRSGSVRKSIPRSVQLSHLGSQISSPSDRTFTWHSSPVRREKLTVSCSVSPGNIIESEDLCEVFSCRVPARIKPLNRLITDEFDDLVTEYNNMADRLTKWYTKMEDQVHERTMEAQESKEHAEAANDNKTKFLMNISHELITPMNGILGIAATTEEETDIFKIRQSLRTRLEDCYKNSSKTF